MAIKHLHRGKEAREYLKIGMWCSNCCREEIEQINTQEDIDDWVEYLEEDEPYDNLTVGDTFEEMWRQME